MNEVIKLLIGILVLLVGFPIGNFLARLTREELNSGQRWFKLIIIACGIGVLISLFFRNDTLLFTFLFIIVVTSRSLRR